MTKATEQLAKLYSDLGWEIVRVHRGNKRPVGLDWPKNTSNDVDILKDWMANDNVGLKLGEESGVIDVEFDTDEGKDILDWCFSDPAEPITTPAYTSGKSIHYIFRFNRSLLPDVTKVQHRGVEIRIGSADKALQSVLPPSRHATGAEYTWIDGRSPLDTPIQNVPMRLFTWAQEAYRLRAESKTEYDDKGNLYVPHGERHDYLKAKAVELRKQGFSKPQMADLLSAYDGTLIHLDQHNADRQIADLIEWSHTNIDPEEAKKTPRVYELVPEWGHELLKREIVREWLVEGLVIKGEPMVVGGPTKSLKTSTMMDLGLSLATGTSFMGFPPSTPRRVVMISGESGDLTLRAFMETWVREKGLPITDEYDIGLQYKLPDLSDQRHVKDLVEQLHELQCDTVILDPLYRSLRVGGDSSNVFQMGETLEEISSQLVPAGITPILIHHFRKMGKNYDPPELEDLSQSGIAEFARQFLFVKRSEEYQHDGRHRVWFSWGGSAGHQGIRMMEATTGVFDPQNPHWQQWKTKLFGLDEWRAMEKDRKEAEKSAKRLDAKNEVLAFLTSHPGSTITSIKKACGKLAGEVLEELLDSEHVTASDGRPVVYTTTGKGCDS